MTSQNANLEMRLRLLGINDTTRYNLNQFHGVFLKNIDEIISKFYGFLMSMPEGVEIFNDKNIIDRLKPKQKEHWLALFSGELDEKFIEYAATIGKVHFDNKIPPYLYVAGYNFFHCEVIEVAVEYQRNPYELSHLLSSITRIINFDMELALSSYTRSYWGGTQKIPSA